MNKTIAIGWETKIQDPFTRAASLDRTIEVSGCLATPGYAGKNDLMGNVSQTLVKRIRNILEVTY